MLALCLLFDFLTSRCSFYTLKASVTFVWSITHAIRLDSHLMRYPVDTFSVKRECCCMFFSVIEEELFHLLFSLFDFVDCLLYILGTSVSCGSPPFCLFIDFFAKAHHLPKNQLSKNISPSELPVMSPIFFLGSNQETPRR